MTKKFFTGFIPNMGMPINKNINIFSLLRENGQLKDLRFSRKINLSTIESHTGIVNFLLGPVMDTVSFSELSKAERKILEYISPKTAETAARETLPIAEKFKKFLDMKFGKDKYVFVSIGRSPDMVGRTLEGMGVEAKYFPISGLHPRYNVDGEIITHTLDDIQLDKFIEYLKSIGLSAEKVKKDSRKFIFYDYTSSGDTLREVKRFFRKRMGLPFFRTDFRSMNNDLENMCGFGKFQKGVRLIKDFVSLITDVAAFNHNFSREEAYIDTYWLGSKSGNFAHIPKLNFFEANKVFDAIRNFKPDNNVRFFNFNILNLLEKAGLLAEKSN